MAEKFCTLHTEEMLEYASFTSQTLVDLEIVAKDAMV